MSMAVIRIALAHPATRRNQPLRHLPMRLVELVKCNRGNMANGNCRASTTWLRVNRSVTLLSPRRPITTTAGRMAIPRVITRRTHGLTRQFMNPSMTTWPANVPVMVLLCPLASRAIANSVLAAAVPSNGASVRYATRIQSLYALKRTTRPPGTQRLHSRQIRPPNPVAVGAEAHYLPARDSHALLAKEHRRRQYQNC